VVFGLISINLSEIIGVKTVIKHNGFNFGAISLTDRGSLSYSLEYVADYRIQF